MQSLIQDLRMLDKVCKEISSDIGRNCVQSWLFPLKLSCDVEIDSDKKEIYVRCLELLVDR